jgi:hypothetical protein
MIMRDYEESSPRMENGLHELDDLDDLDDPIEPCSDMDELFLEYGSNDRDSVVEYESLSLGLRISF